jgi:hypothetical protein
MAPNYEGRNGDLQAASPLRHGTACRWLAAQAQLPGASILKLMRGPE